MKYISKNKTQLIILSFQIIDSYLHASAIIVILPFSLATTNRCGTGYPGYIYDSGGNTCCGLKFVGNYWVIGYQTAIIIQCGSGYLSDDSKIQTAGLDLFDPGAYFGGGYKARCLGKSPQNIYIICLDVQPS